MPKIEVVISEDGSTVVETSGFKGKACQDATKQLLQALGTVQSEQLKAEFYQKEDVKQQNRGKSL